MDPKHHAMDQLTSSQQALPNCLPSQGLYALLLMRVGVGVHSLSARSFKVRHSMQNNLAGKRIVYLRAEWLLAFMHQNVSKAELCNR